MSDFLTPVLMSFLFQLPWYIAIGLLAGFLAGLFGVGGGLTIVPLLLMVLGKQGFPETLLMHMSLGTAMASIIFTSIASANTHRKHDAVRWDILKTFTPGLMLGSFIAAHLTQYISTRPLAITFTVVVYAASILMYRPINPKATAHLPQPLVITLVGMLIGSVAAMVSAGGSFLIIPFMLFCGINMRQAVGTSASTAFPVALTGTIAAVINGYHHAELPPFSLGFVYLPALLSIISASMLIAPIGARLAHRLPIALLKKGFAIFMMILATQMLWTVIQTT
jgi:uncharacterized membrane protein YfcA